LREWKAGAKTTHIEKSLLQNDLSDKKVQFNNAYIEYALTMQWQKWPFKFFSEKLIPQFKQMFSPRYGLLDLLLPQSHHQLLWCGNRQIPTLNIEHLDTEHLTVAHPAN